MPTCDENWGRAFFDGLRAEEHERKLMQVRRLVRDARHAAPDDRNTMLEAAELCLIEAGVP